MPHLFTNRRRQHNVLSSAPAGSAHFGWQSVNSTVYLLGGVAFAVGSIFFFPQFQERADVGAWIFFGGSLGYLLVTAHDLVESVGYYRSGSAQREGARLPGGRTVWKRLEVAVAVVYVSGSALFAVGSIFFLSRVGMLLWGSWCFIVGSLMFLIGAGINVAQIIRAGSLLTLQLMNATAVCFTLGSAIFLVATIPYLWQQLRPTARTTVLTYAAWEYFAGSILFLAGGGFNFVRSYLAMKHYRRHDTIDAQ